MLLTTKAIIGLTMKNGGCTVLFNGQMNPTTGYIVANGFHGEKMAPSELSQEKLETLASRFQALQSDGLGTWIDKADNSLYIDPVYHISSRDEAIALAIANSEIAIWDCQAQSEIRLTA